MSINLRVKLLGSEFDEYKQCTAFNTHPMSSRNL